MLKVMRNFIFLTASNQWVEVEEAVWEFPDNWPDMRITYQNEGDLIHFAAKVSMPKLVSIKLKDKQR